MIHLYWFRYLGTEEKQRVFLDVDTLPEAATLNINTLFSIVYNIVSVPPSANHRSKARLVAFQHLNNANLRNVCIVRSDKHVASTNILENIYPVAPDHWHYRAKLTCSRQFNVDEYLLGRRRHGSRARRWNRRYHFPDKSLAFVRITIYMLRKRPGYAHEYFYKIFLT